MELLVESRVRQADLELGIVFGYPWYVSPPEASGAVQELGGFAHQADHDKQTRTLRGLGASLQRAQEALLCRCAVRRHFEDAPRLPPNVASLLQSRFVLWPSSERPDVLLLKCVASAAQMVVHGGIGAGDLAKGYFITPSMFEIDDVHHDLVQDELFGPIVSLERFGDEDEALAKANATRYGLAASVYTTDLNRSMRMGRKLAFGTVWMNCHNRLLAEVETGGYRESGIGRLHGVEAMNDFLETKHIYLETES